ncbi:MAG: SDR family oxidoreductase [Christiangramia sp.]|nr:SDR family oxidoreductase [Christiangramia sp.]
MKFDLNKKNIIVTGGGSGIGKAISKTLAEQGATVFILDLNKKNGEKIIAEITKTGNKAMFFFCNVSVTEEVESTISAIAENYPIHVLINNAGIAHVGNLENTTPEDLDRIYEVNVKGVFNCARAVLKHMKSSGGLILNMASVASSMGISERFAYSMSKGAVLTMTYSIAKDYVGEGIRCNCISPARVHTPFVDGFIATNYPDNQEEMYNKLSASQPIGRMGTPEEVANLTLYLCSDEASFITGSNFSIDGGFTKLNG